MISTSQKQSSSTSSKPGIGRPSFPFAGKKPETGGIQCPSCEKLNPLFSRFCNTCGKPIGLNRAQTAKKPVSQSSAPPALRPSLTGKKTAIPATPETVFSFPKPREKSPFSALPRAIGASHETSPTGEEHHRDWRRFVARHLFILALGLTVFGVYSVARTMKPPSSLWAAQASKNVEIPKVERRLFSDIPYGHPVYTAWKPLLDWSVPLSDEFGAAHPFTAVTYENWRSAVLGVIGRCPLSDGGAMILGDLTSGTMTGKDVSRSLKTIRHTMKLPAADFLAEFSSRPSRMESFAALGSVVEDYKRLHRGS